ncbi:DNA gyrase inhibitor YacG [Shewanella sp. NFH-SH190041]|uniref:DNA gyrase inhibitor YacG n=1 Tax=Shewanella sp. NFH-SH190041 TaxID=2950245 RepID=UPI0021C3BFE0|nr:DNA gyrase inhibitor YacG [Shewanella sp. NFH-SH190041]BDM65907.1 DNA gyrase inhibitor YacG [Shewanella sp. NFH-SH190041]
MPLTVKCPTCDSKVEWKPENKFRPFCSERCKLIDLGEWASESYAIPVKSEFDLDKLDSIGFDDPQFFKERDE